MIWTVILKNGDNFVVHGSSFDRNTEVRKSLTGRKLGEDAVAGIVQGNHPVEPYRSALHPTETYSSQFKAALTAPNLDGGFTDSVMDEVLANPKTDGSPVDEHGRPFNDPSEW